MIMLRILFDIVVFQFYSLTELYISNNIDTAPICYDTNLYSEEGRHIRQEG